MTPRLFAIADLHLSHANPKPMDIFGPHWAKHADSIASNWREIVTPEDIVLIAGDISWAMKMRDAMADLEWLAALPGRKVMIKGNHDYWWSSIKRVRKSALEGLFFIQNDMIRIDDIAMAGTRLWDFPGIRWPAPESGVPPMTEEAKAVVGRSGQKEVDPERIRNRELERLKLSLSKLPDDAYKVALVHFPPIGDDGEPTEITAIMDSFEVDLCVFGHLHGLGTEPRHGADCRINSTRYVLTACDWLDFKPFLIDLP